MTHTLLDSKTQREALKKLLSWYKKNGRHDMPWRKTSDPYAILLSEFMLQQTTVSTVKPYYERFLRRFPTLISLAEASLDDVLALWSGLGYYARARNLWHAANDIASLHRGKIPRDQKTLQTLPGIGLYTSGAVASLAFGEPAVAVDANIIRVFMRLLAIEDDPKLKAVQTLLQKLSLDFSTLAKKSFKKEGGARATLLALMDLGATLCAPKTPSCASCPASSYCLARQSGWETRIPPVEETKDRPTVRLLYALIEKNGAYLLAKRPAAGLFGGLWEFPGVEAPPNIETVPFLEKRLKAEVGISIRVKEALTPFEHDLSHRVLLIRGYWAQLKSAPSALKPGDRYKAFSWVPKEKVLLKGLSAATKRLFSEWTHREHVSG